MERLTRGQAIRKKCLDCCCGNSAEVRRCHITECALHRYRLGHEDTADDKSIMEENKI